MIMTHYFVTGYSEGDEFARTTVSVAPEDDAERGRQYEGLLCSDAAQEEGMLAFAVEAQDDVSALLEGRKRHAAWINSQ